MRAATLLALFLTSACDDHCPNGDGTIQTVDGGTTDLDAMIYSSTPWGGEYQEFNGGATLDFPHGLGVAPELVQTYLSFTEGGVNDSNAAENAGDSGYIECVDAEVIRLHNHTCQDFYVRVAAISTALGSGDVVPCDERRE